MTNSVEFYRWNGFRCGYKVYNSDTISSENFPLLLIHPIGVGLSGIFWQRFITTWLAENPKSTIYNPDLLGCGASDMPSVAYHPEDWAEQLAYFLENIVRQPVNIVVQGASLPIAIALLEKLSHSDLVSRLILSAPPAWRTMTNKANPLQNKLLWNLLFDSPVGLGNLFYRYARRRQFIESFSVRQLFGEEDRVDSDWLDELTKGAKNIQSRYAVFSFLAGFWRKDYSSAIAKIKQPTLVVLGDRASSISREGKIETLQERLDSYLQHLPQGKGCIISGRNVLPYESTLDFVKAINDFLS